jgi:hypothetical protein
MRGFAAAGIFYRPIRRICNSAKSGIIGTTKEAMASMKAVVAGKNDYPDNEVIGGILEKAESFSDAKEKAGAFREKAMADFKSQNIQSPDEFNTYMLSNCQKAIALVGERSGAQAASEYRQWSMAIAEKVAQAASEGGFLGFGGEQVSEGEKQLLAKIEQTLNVMA